MRIRLFYDRVAVDTQQLTDVGMDVLLPGASGIQPVPDAGIRPRGRTINDRRHIDVAGTTLIAHDTATDPIGQHNQSMASLLLRVVVEVIEKAFSRHATGSQEGKRCSGVGDV